MENVQPAAEKFVISSDKTLLQFERIMALLKQSYWANDQTEEATRTAIQNSVCFGLYVGGVQVGFARVITDYSTVFYLSDVLIDERHRGRGYGTALVKAVLDDPRYKDLYGMLITRDAHGLYEKFDFHRNAEIFMFKKEK